MNWRNKMTTKEYDKETALAKIKVLISRFYERVGREGGEDIEMSAEKSELIDDIEEVLNKTEISSKHVVIEQLDADDEVKRTIKKRWNNDRWTMKGE